MRLEKYKLVLYALLGIFWLGCASGFVIDEFLPFLDGHKGNITLLCEMGVLALGILTMRRASDILIFVFFLGLAYVSTCLVNDNGLFRYLLGLRDFAGLLCALPILRWLVHHGPEGDFMRRFNRQLYIWLVLQAVCITWQFIRYGAGDRCGGTFGNQGSGNTTTCIYIVSLFFLMQNWDADNILASIKKNARYLILLYPTMLNETKISFIYLAVYLFLMLPFNRKFSMRLAIGIPAAAIVFTIFGVIYGSTVQTQQDSLFTSEFYEAYFYGDDMDRILEKSMMLRDGEIDADDLTYFGDSDIPRIAKYLLLWPKLEDIRGGVAFGAGISQFQGWNSENYTKFANPNRYLLYGTKPWGFWVMTQLGLLGLLFTCCLLVRNLWVPSHGNKKILKISLFLMLIFIGSFLYNDCWRVYWFDIILFYIPLYMRNAPAGVWQHPEA